MSYNKKLINIYTSFKKKTGNILLLSLRKFRSLNTAFSIILNTKFTKPFFYSKNLFSIDKKYKKEFKIWIIKKIVLYVYTTIL